MEKSKKASQNRLADYIQKCLNLALRSVLWVGISLALNIGLMYFSQLLLGFYLKSPMGPDFVESNGELMDTIAKLTAMGFEQLSLTLTLTAFATCLGILVPCKLFFLARYIAPMGIIGRAIVCVLPFSAVVAWLIPESVPTGGWAMAYALSVVPTLAMFNVCFTTIDVLLPEGDDLIAFFQKNDDSGKKFNVRR